jgi:hypothetical protein
MYTSLSFALYKPKDMSRSRIIFPFRSRISITTVCPDEPPATMSVQHAGQSTGVSLYCVLCTVMHCPLYSLRATIGSLWGAGAYQTCPHGPPLTMRTHITNGASDQPLTNKALATNKLQYLQGMLQEMFSAEESASKLAFILYIIPKIRMFPGILRTSMCIVNFIRFVFKLK